MLAEMVQAPTLLDRTWGAEAMADSGRAAAEVVLAVWAAEDGRCEACKRPMDKRWARVARLDDSQPRTLDNLQLLCVDCKARRPDPLKTRDLILGPEVAARVLGQLAPEQLEGATRWLAGQLKRYGVIVWVGKEARNYWLPGVGSFRLNLVDEGTAVVEQVEKLAATPEVKVKPQERTRGFPRPDRRPLQAHPMTGR
ncbi:MAG TPA: hypothetical protein VKQ30_24920 [Ktedonobacterales bacterium]|nr:hypothetical protein [Ktedonobacterales bacterium]